MAKIAVFPGSFDPITLGHVNIVKRAAPLFDKVIVAIGNNTSKKYYFTFEQRKQWIDEIFKDYPNVEYQRMDMSAYTLTVTPCDVAVCINAILTDNLKKRINFFQSLNICLNQGGTLILVVPSLESKLYSNIIAHRWNVDDDNKEKIESVEKAYALAKNIKQGVTDIDNVPTKHYLKEELELLLKLDGFTVDRVEKINYTWKTEFNNPPKWLDEPHPWDWMCVAKKL